MHQLPNIAFILAHTIGQHIEELYGQVFLPIYIATSLLPFLAIGFLIQPNPRFKQQTILFLISISLGILSCFLFNIWIWNFLASKGILLLGGLLILSGTKLSSIASYAILFLAGASLGMERGKEIVQSHEWTWFFVTMFLVGATTSVLIAKIDFINISKHQNARLLLGFTFFISGVALILLF